MSERNHSAPAWWHAVPGKTISVLAAVLVLALASGFLLYDAFRPETASAQTQTRRAPRPRTQTTAGRRPSSVARKVLTEPTRAPAAPTRSGLAAKVNGAPITFDDLVEACMRRYGETVLDELINKKILEQECAKQRITVPPAEIDAEIDAEAKRRSMERTAYLNLLKEEHGVAVETLVKDIIWPRLALKRLAGADVKVLPSELQKSFESNFGERVKARMIMCKDERHARQVWEKANAAIKAGRLEEFARLAKDESTDPATRSLGGLIPPIHRHSGMPALEEEAFRLKEGELSAIVQVGNNYIILLCEGRTTPIDVTMKEVRPQLEADIYEKKIKQNAYALFDNLKEAATIENYLTRTSKKGRPVANAPAAGTSRGVQRRAAAPRPVRTASGTRRGTTTSKRR